MDVFDLFAKLSLDSSEYESGLDKAKGMGASLGSGLASAAKVGLAAVTAATGATVAFAGSAVEAGKNFDSSMSQVAATMGTTVDNISDLRDFAQEMGRTTAFSATQAADALNYMALAGYDVNESMEMLPNVLNLAAAGSIDLARASDMVTDTQTAFGISADRTTQMVDEMAKAASTGNTSVEQLGDAFLTVGGLAQELNGGMVTLDDGTVQAVDGIQELEIALTAMANAGIKGNEAGTHMRNMLLKLSSPTDAGTMALENMGVAVFDTEGKMRSLSDIFGDLNNALGQMTQEQKIQTISDLFNTRDLASAEALLNAVSEDWDNIGESILNAKGASEQMAKTQLDNLAGDITLFQSALEGAQIAVSDALTPTLREFVQFGTDGLSKLTEAFSEGGVSGAMEAFGEILSDGLDMIIEKTPMFIDAGMNLLSALGQGVLDNLDSIIDTAIQVVDKLTEGFIIALPKLAQGAIQIITKLSQALLSNAPQLIQSAMQMINEIVVGIAQALPTLIPIAVDIVLTIVEALIDNIDLLIDAAIQLQTGLAEGLIAALPVLLEKAPEIIQKLVDALIENLPLLVEAALQLVLAIQTGIIQNLPLIIEAALKIIGALITGCINEIPAIVDMAVKVIGAFKDAIFKADTKSWGVDLMKALIDGIMSMIVDVGKAALSVADKIAEVLHFSEPDIGPLSNFHTFAPDMMDLFIKGINDNENALQSAVSSAFDFQNLITPPVMNAGNTSANTGSQNGNGDVVIVLELDKTPLAKAIYNLNLAESRRVGVRLANV